MPSLLRRCTAILLAAIPAALATAQPATPTFSNIQYGDGQPAQVLDIYIPPGTAPDAARPCIVFIHGGGWSGGDKNAAAAKVPALAGLGFVVVGINYRLSGVATHPAQIHDCKAAIRHIRANAAAYRVDPDRIGVWGSSAGGHLVALVGTSGDVPPLEGTVGGNATFAGPVQAVADYFGPSEFLSITDPAHTACNSPESAMLGVCLGNVIANIGNPAFAQQVALVRQASPTTHVTSNDPPFYIAFGTADPVVQPQQNVILYNDLIAAGVPAAIRAVQGAGHGLAPLEDVATRKFLARTLGVPLCPADWNANGIATVQDIFDFLSAYFGNLPSADINFSGALGTQDLFDFLAAYFAGCAG